MGSTGSTGPGIAGAVLYRSVGYRGPETATIHTVHSTGGKEEKKEKKRPRWGLGEGGGKGRVE